MLLAMCATVPFTLSRVSFSSVHYLFRDVYARLDRKVVLSLWYPQPAL